MIFVCSVSPWEALLVALAVCPMIYQGMVRQRMSLLHSFLVLGAVLGAGIGFLFDISNKGAVYGGFIGALCALPVKKDILTGQQAKLIGTLYLLIGLACVGVTTVRIVLCN